MKIFLIPIFISIACSIEGASIDCNSSGLLERYKQYLDCSGEKAFCSFDLFERYVKSYYYQDPLECIRFAYKEDWQFRLAFFAALLNPFGIPIKDENRYYEWMLIHIGKMIIRDSLDVPSSNEEKNRHFEVMDILIAIYQETIAKTGSPRIDDYLSQVLIFKFLHQNLSFEYALGTIDYRSFFSSFQNILVIMGETNDPKNSSQELINNCFQFIIYSFIISTKNCIFLFEYEGIERMPLALFYILRYIRDGAFVFERLTIDPSQCIKDLIKFLEGDITAKMATFLNESLDFLPESECLQNLSLNPEIKSFTQLGNFLDVESLKSTNPYFLWNLKGLKILEQYLVQHPPQ